MWVAGGWVGLALERGTAFVRFAAAEDGRLAPVELRIVDAGELTMELVRSVPLPRLEALANNDDHHVGWRESLDSKPGDLSPPDWDHAAVAHRAVRARVKVPTSARYPDEFYAQVAAVYSKLAELGYPPGKTIADENDQGIATVRRWIKEARRRGHLPPGRRGKVG
jgi:hypothetical protein